jgi:uncharacterized protein with PIN domain
MCIWEGWRHICACSVSIAFIAMTTAMMSCCGSRVRSTASCSAATTGLLKRAALTHGAFLHATDPRRQVREVMARFQLDALVSPFTRCARCNGAVKPLDEAEQATAAERIGFLPEGPTKFSRCCDCGQLYWPGSHLVRLRQRLAEVGVTL